MAVHEDLIAAREEGPHSDVEFASFVEQRSLDVLLHDAAGERGPRVDEARQFLQIREDLNAAALVRVAGLHKPDVVNAVLDGDPLFSRKPFLDVLVTLDELCPLLILLARC